MRWICYCQWWVIFFVLSGQMACNLLESLDTPSTDAQRFEAAVAYLDDSLFAKTLTSLKQIKSTAYDSDKLLMEVFISMSEIGIPAARFLKIIAESNGSAGVMLTKMANAMIPFAGESARLKLLDTYSLYKQMPTTQGQAVIRFLGATLIASEVLAEDAVEVGTLKQSNLVKTPVECKQRMKNFSFTNLQNLNAALQSCQGPTSTKLIAGREILTIKSATISEMSGSPTLFMILASIRELQDAILSLTDKSKFAESSVSFANQLLSQGGLTITTSSDKGSPIFRGLLLANSIGEEN